MPKFKDTDVTDVEHIYAQTPAIANPRWNPML